MKRKAFLPYGRQHITEDDIQAVVDVLRSDYLTTGPKIEEFEKSVADYVGAKYAVAFCNGTAALHGACYAAGIKEGDEVITSPMTFAASANCVLYQRGTPVFADIDKKTYNICLESIEKKITAKTKAIIPVDFTGQPVDLDEILALAKKNNLVVIEDAAHALGAEYKGKKVGSISDMTMFSFHPVKHITTGEGGMITTNNEEYYKKLLLFRSHGITRNTELMHDYDGAWYYEMLELGYNYRMTDIQAALGISQLKKLDGFISKRNHLVDQYNFMLKDIEGITMPCQSDDRMSSWHLYIIKLDSAVINISRKDMFDKLINRNIGVNVHYIPVYYHPYYQSLGYYKGICPNAESLYEEIITLPLFPGMTDQDVHYVVNNLKEILNEAKR